MEVWDKGRTHLGFSPKQQGVARGDELEKSIIGVPKEPIEDFSRIMHRYTHTQTHTHIQKTKTKTDQEPPGKNLPVRLVRPRELVQVDVGLESCDQT